MSNPKDKPEIMMVATNHEAGRDYFILETVEAGIVLVGCEVKSLRGKQASLAGSFARLEGDEVFLYNMHIAPYAMGNRENPEPLRERKLLLHRSQIEKLRTKTTQKGMALVPLKVYFSDRGIVKVEIAVVKGKRFADRREDLKKKSIMREIDRAIKNRNRK